MSHTTTGTRWVAERAAAELQTRLRPTDSIVPSALAMSTRHLIQAASGYSGLYSSRASGPWQAVPASVSESIHQSVKFQRIAIANRDVTFKNFICPVLGPEAEAEIRTMMETTYQTMMAMLDDPDHEEWKGCRLGCDGSGYHVCGEGSRTPRPGSHEEGSSVRQGTTKLGLSSGRRSREKQGYT